MPIIEKHCEESIQLFGKPYAEIHKWLDEFAGSKEYGYRHRRKRHHEDGIRQVIELFGIEAGEAARQHIIFDLKEGGWTDRDRFPKDERDYIEMGLF
jgi:hypothetical protein